MCYKKNLSENKDDVNENFNAPIKVWCIYFLTVKLKEEEKL